MFDPTSKINQTLHKNLTEMVKAQQNILETIPHMSGSAFQQAVAQAYGEMFGEMMQHPDKIMEMQMKYWEQQGNIWMNFMNGMMGMPATPVVEPPKGDKRFTDEDWLKSPYHYYLMQSYLNGASAVMKSVDEFGGDGLTKRKLNYHARQLVEALSPSNYFLTNPDAIHASLETKGKSLIDGFKNMIADLHQGRVTMTDTKQFRVGQNIATTRGAVVYENDLMQLIQYSPTTEKTYELPVLIVPPWINKYYILDLQESNSLIKHTVDQGFTTFVVSWRNPGNDMGDTSWEDYMTKGMLQPMDAVLSICGTPQLNLVGYCIGGTLTGCVLSYLHSMKKNIVQSTTFFTAMVDFTDPGEIAIFVDEKQIEEREREYMDGGVYPGNVMSNAFAFLRANDLVWNYVVQNYLKGEDYAPFDLLYWNSDPTNLPGNMYLYYIRNMYLENNITRPGKLKLLGKPIDVSKVSMPMMSIACREDHIAPWPTVYKSLQAFGGTDKQFVLGASGHIAGVVNPPAKKKREFWYSGDLKKDNEGWFKTAKQEPGSWWPYWFEWLKPHSGKQVPAPKALGNKIHPVIEPAPGRYVTEQVDVTGWAM